MALLDIRFPKDAVILVNINVVIIKMMKFDEDKKFSIRMDISYISRFRKNAIEKGNTGILSISMPLKCISRALANLEFQKCFKGPPLKSRGAFDGDIKIFNSYGTR